MKRYSADMGYPQKLNTLHLVENDQGYWCAWEDVKELEQENEKLKSVIDRLENLVPQMVEAVKEIEGVK